MFVFRRLESMLCQQEGGRERIVVAIKSTPGLGLGTKASRHSAKRHKKNASGEKDPSPQPSKKSSKERRATRTTNSTSSSPPPPPVEKRTIKISMSSNSTPTIKKPEKVNADKVASEKQASTSPSSTSTTSSPPVTTTTPTTTTTKSTRSATQQQQTVNTSPANGTSTGRKKGLARIKVTPTDKSSVRASKRPRLQYQPYQAPASVGSQFPVFKSPPHKGNDDKIMVFQKGEFLAVRNENGGFYVCRTAQNVYKHSRRFRIQWLNSGKDANVYSPDFYDATDFECVLTNLRMKRMEKNKYLLPDEERKRTMNILQRALNVESGMDKPDPHQVTGDGGMSPY
ncbi:hypothetical protein LAZ67_22000813 [Cordylochernes scorpioides]|uniref:Uncharacterized protein n=1 Tax=Cordylochernes scorpioides TaxID=51811 RepID=A0ABY6LQD0_9ARAC|nr:hypothetical protein LAZ67_22000813 [Cordylochernes scorpioides]